MKTFAIIAFLFLSCSKTFAQDKQDMIIWRPDYKLKWEDFQGLPDTNSISAAISDCSFLCNYDYSDSKIIFHVKSVFYKKKSWVNKIKINMNNLRHEQTHFNISEYFARMLLRELENAHLNNLNRNTLQQEVQKICNSVSDQDDAMSQLYDLETDYSRNEVMQDKWNKKLEQMLEEAKPVPNR